MGFALFEDGGLEKSSWGIIIAVATLGDLCGLGALGAAGRGQPAAALAVGYTRYRTGCHSLSSPRVRS